MKSCISILFIILLVPILFSALLLTSLNNILLNELNFRDILSDSSIKKDINTFLVFSIKDSLSNKSEDLKSIINNTNGEIAIKKFVETFKVHDTFADNMVILIKYMNGKEQNLNIYITPKITDSDFENFKQDIITAITDGILSLKKCANTDSTVVNCRQPSLSTQDIVTNIRESANKAFNISQIKNAVQGKLPISIDTKRKIDNIKDSYIIFKNTIAGLWIISILLILIIILINIYPKIHFFSYLGSALFSIVLLSLITGLIFCLLWKRGNYITATQLGMSSEYSVDTSNAAVDLVNNIASSLFNILFINFFIISGILFLISVIMWLIDFLLKKRRDGKLFEREYSINAFSKKMENASESIYKNRK